MKKKPKCKTCGKTISPTEAYIIISGAGKVCTGCDK